MSRFPAIVLTASMFLLVNVAALALSVPFLTNEVASYQAFEDPDSWVNPLIYVAMLIVFSVILIILIKKFHEKVLRYVLLFSIFTALFYVFFLPSVYGVAAITGYPPYHTYAVCTGAPFAAIAALALTSLLSSDPEWYVVDGIGILVASGITAILGISLGILPVMILLVALAIYDYVAVYRTKHMLTLADAASKQKVPAMLVVPATSDYSLKRSKGFSDEKEKVRSGKREAMFIGLGDVVIPGALTVSSFIFLPWGEVFGLPASLFVAGFTMAGTIAGLSILNIMISKGRPHAGLPVLNGMSILFYAMGYLAVYQDFSFGLW